MKRIPRPLESRLLKFFLPALALLSSASSASAETVRVFAAASLTQAFREIGAVYGKARPGDRVEFNFAGSQLLRTQIEQGAPADVFASADPEHMEALRRKRLAVAPRVFARNRLVVVTPAGRGTVRRLADLARPGVKVVLAGPTVPAGRYALQALRKMNGVPPFPRDFSRRVEANVVSRETNVRAVLAKVALGEADAGFVYGTDAAAARGRVRVLPIPARLNVTATYPVAIVAAGRTKPGANAFMGEVLSPRGQVILRKYGFLR